MKLTEYTIKDFVQLTASDAPAPGGGSASALAGSVGAALGCMVAGLTVGKVKYAASEDLMKKIISEANALVAALLEDIDKDTEAFNGVTAVFSMPKATDEEKAARKEAMQQALKNATIIPFGVMEHCDQALTLVEQAVGCSNTNAASDLGVAALNLKSGVQGAWLNVLINLSGITDADFVAKYKNGGQELVKKACATADGVYTNILNSL